VHKATSTKNTTSKVMPPLEPPVQKKFVKKIPGQKDFLPEEWADLDHLLERLKNLAKGFGFSRIEPSLFEVSEINAKFHVKEGKAPVLKVSGADEAVFRTNAISGLLRMYLDARTPEKERLSKWYFISPVTVHHENPYQIVSNLEYGFEVIGDESPIFDAQVLALAWKLYSVLGEDKIVLEIGSRGCENCWPEYQQILSRTFSDAKYSLCKECAASVEKHPEKILVCEQAECQSIAADAPAFIDYLDAACSSHLTTVLESLDELKVSYVLMTGSDLDPHARRTVFRFKFNHPQDSFILSHGMRHDHLFSHFNVSPRPALGLVGDFSKFLRAWHLSGAVLQKAKSADVALIPLGELGAKKALSLFSNFWDEMISVVNLFDENGLKARLQQAADMKVPIALIVGQKEALEDTVILRDVKSGMQEVFTSERILSEVRKRLGE